MYDLDEESLDEVVVLSLLDISWHCYLVPHNYKESNWQSLLHNLDVLSEGEFLLLCRTHSEQ